MWKRMAEALDQLPIIEWITWPPHWKHLKVDIKDGHETNFHMQMLSHVYQNFLKTHLWPILAHFVCIYMHMLILTCACFACFACCHILMASPCWYVYLYFFALTEREFDVKQNKNIYIESDDVKWITVMLTKAVIRQMRRPSIRVMRLRWWKYLLEISLKYSQILRCHRTQSQML